MVGNGTGRWPEQATCVHTAGVEGVHRGERAAGRPCEPPHLGLFAPVRGSRVSLRYLSAVGRDTTMFQKPGDIAALMTLDAFKLKHGGPGAGFLLRRAAQIIFEPGMAG